MISTNIHELNAIAKEKPHNHIGATLMTTNPYPLYYRMITKCGCTYIMNILHLLNYGTQNPDPFAVHTMTDLIPKANNATNQQITNSPYSFVIIRNPVQRFMSLYFDKLYGTPRISETHGIGEYFIRNGLVEADVGENIQKHRENCIRSISWIKQNLAGLTDQKPNYHWRPQKNRLSQIRAFKFNVLLLEDINYQLCKILAPLVPEIRNVMAQVSAKNKSTKPIKPSDVLDEELVQMIRSTYPRDTRIYREVSNYWRDIKKEE